MARRKDEWLTPEALLLIEGWARDGLTAREIAQNIGVSHVTFYRWVDEEETIRKALWNGREVANRKLENALFKRALGFFETETEITDDEKNGHKVAVIGSSAARNIRDGYTYVDCTTGGGGHSLEIAKRLGKNSRLICFDRDKSAIKAATERLKDYNNFKIIKRNR